MDHEDEARASAELNRANQAASILDSPLVKDALVAIRAKAESAWKRANPAKPEDLQAAAMLYQAAEVFETELKQHVRTGKLAEAKLEQSRSRQRR